jgi:hypothetical protein
MLKRPFPFLLTGLLFIVLSIVFSYYPAITRVWGLNYPGCFGLWFSIPFYILLLLLWMPRTNGFIIERLSKIRFGPAIEFCRKRRHAIFLLIGVVAGVCFRLLQIKYIFLGDTDLRVTEIENNGTSREEYLTMEAIRCVYLFLHERFGYTGLQTFRLFDYVTGGLFIFFSLCIADLVGNTLMKKAAAMCMSALSLAVLLVFCGYTETYMMPAMFLSLYMYTAMLYLRGRIPFFIPLLTCLLGIGMHLMLVSMIPGLIFLIYSKELWKRPFFKRRQTIAGLALIATPLIYIGYIKFATKMILPLHGDGVRMTMFSIAHCVEFFNSQMLGGGIGFLIWIATLAYSIVLRIKYNSTLWFFQISSLSIFLLMFVFVSARGSADWDISSFAAIAFNLSNAVFLIHAYNQKLIPNIRYGILMVAGFSILHSSSWILTNKTDASIKWIESAFSTDPTDYYTIKLGGAAMISVALSANGLHERSLPWAAQACIDNPTDRRTYYNFALSLYAVGQTQKANATLEATISAFPSYARPYGALIYYNKSNPELLSRVLLQFEEVYQKNPDDFGPVSAEEINYYFTLLKEIKQQPPQTAAPAP